MSERDWYLESRRQTHVFRGQWSVYSDRVSDDAESIVFEECRYRVVRSSRFYKAKSPQVILNVWARGHERGANCVLVPCVSMSYYL